MVSGTPGIRARPVTRGRDVAVVENHHGKRTLSFRYIHHARYGEVIARITDEILGEAICLGYGMGNLDRPSWIGTLAQTFDGVAS
jgi:hypothetical protein